MFCGSVSTNELHAREGPRSEIWLFMIVGVIVAADLQD